MNELKRNLPRKLPFLLIRKCFFFDSIEISHFSLKNNESLLYNNVYLERNQSILQKCCENFLKNFETFASVCCGCTTPRNKVQLKKSIWFSTIGLEMNEFLEFYNKDKEELKIGKIEIIKEIIKMPCPVILKDKNSVLIESEISPKKIINSCKRMRYHFSLSEIYSCRTCSQKSKCKRFSQKYSGFPDFSDFTRVLIGFYNICKIYLKRNEDNKKELISYVEKVYYFHFVLFYVYNYMLKYKSFNYTQTEEGNKSSILKYLREKRRNKEMVKTQRLQEKLLHIPKEYSNCLIPTTKAKMKKRQKNVFEKLHKFRIKNKMKEEEEKFIWVEEENPDEESVIMKKKEEEAISTNITTTKLNHDINSSIISESDTLINIQNSKEEYFPSFRFQYLSNKKQEDDEVKSVQMYNKLYHTYSNTLQQVFVNLDEQNMLQNNMSEEELFRLPESYGGYTFVNTADKETSQNYLFPINENMFKGVEVYQREEIKIDSLWKDFINERLKIRRIGFYTPFNIKKIYELKQNKKQNEYNESYKEDEIIELKDEMEGFQEFLYEQKKNQQEALYGDRRKRMKYIKSKDEIDVEKEKEEDERFEYFKQLQQVQSNFHKDKNELKEQFNYDDIYAQNDKTTFGTYTHTHHIRRTLGDEKNELGIIPSYEIEKEKRKLIEEDKRQIKENTYYVCKNLKFPELKNETKKKRNESNLNNSKNDLEKYIKPKVHNKNTKDKKEKKD